MSFEIILTPCHFCKKVFGKRSNESGNRRSNRKFCSVKCSKDEFRRDEKGWFSFGAQTIGKKKKEDIDDIAPRIWSDAEYKEFYEAYPELSAFT